MGTIAHISKKLNPQNVKDHLSTKMDALIEISHSMIDMGDQTINNYKDSKNLTPWKLPHLK